MELAKNQQRDDGPRQRTNANRNQAQQQRTQRTKYSHDEQDHPEHSGYAEGRDIFFRLLAGVIAIEQRPARQQLSLWIVGFELTFQRIQRGDQLMRLLHIKR